MPSKKIHEMVALEASYPCKLFKNTIVQSVYNEDLIYERHRHRYEFNNAYRKPIENVNEFLACHQAKD